MKLHSLRAGDVPLSNTSTDVVITASRCSNYRELGSRARVCVCAACHLLAGDSSEQNKFAQLFTRQLNNRRSLRDSSDLAGRGYTNEIIELCVSER